MKAKISQSDEHIFQNRNIMKCVNRANIGTRLKRSEKQQAKEKKRKLDETINKETRSELMIVIHDIYGSWLALLGR